HCSQAPLPDHYHGVAVAGRTPARPEHRSMCTGSAVEASSVSHIGPWGTWGGARGSFRRQAYRYIGHPTPRHRLGCALTDSLDKTGGQDAPAAEGSVMRPRNTIAPVVVSRRANKK